MEVTIIQVAMFTAKINAITTQGLHTTTTTHLTHETSTTTRLMIITIIFVRSTMSIQISVTITEVQYLNHTHMGTHREDLKDKAIILWQAEKIWNYYYYLQYIFYMYCIHL